MSRSTSLLLALALVACNGDDPDVTETGDDTGEEYVQPWEDGCIASSDGKTFAVLLDGITYADPGSTLTLCEGTLEEALVISSEEANVTIEANPAGTIWVAPTNTAALTVEAGVVTLAGVEVQTTRSGVVVTGGIVTLTDLVMNEPGNYAVDVAGGEVTITGLQTTLAGWGGIKVEGAGSVTMSDSTISEPESFGVLADGDVDVTLTNNTISDAAYTDNSGYLFEADGTAVWGTSGARLTLQGNEFLGNDISSVQVENATLSIESDTLFGSFVNLLARNSSVTVSNAELTNYRQYGAYLESGDDVTFVGTTFEASEASQASSLNDAGSYVEGSIGIRGYNASASVTDSSIRGNNSGGIVLRADDATSPALAITGGDVTANGAFGIAVFNGTLDIDGTDVLDTLGDPNCLSDAGWTCDMAIAAWSSNLTMTGGSVSGTTANFGIATVSKLGTVTDTVLSNNANYAIAGFSSAMNLSSLTLDGNGAYGLFLNSGEAAVTNTTFTNATFTNGYEYEIEGVLYETRYKYNAWDIYAYDATLVVEDTTFDSGERGAQLATNTKATFKNVTWNNYNDYGVYAYSSEVEVDNAILTESGGSAVYCSSASVELSDMSISDHRERYSYYEYYTDGESTGTSESAYVTNLMYLNNCDFQVEDLAVTSSLGPTMSAYDSSVELEGITLTDTGERGSSNGALYLSYRTTDTDGDGADDAYTRTPEATLLDVTITGEQTGGGIKIAGTEGYEGGSITLQGIRIEADDEGTGIPGTGISVAHAGDVTVEGIDLTAIGADGISITGMNATVTGAWADWTGTIASPTDAGVRLKDATATVSGLSITDAGGDGISVNGGSATLSGNTVTAAGAWGLTCSNEPTLDECTDSFDGVTGAISSACSCP